MRINPVVKNYMYVQKTTSAQGYSPVGTSSSTETRELNASYYLPLNLSFKQAENLKESDFKKAKAYLGGLKDCGDVSLEKVDLQKANGIQYGLKTFEGLNMKELAFMLKDLEILTVKRGCKNHCAHCIFNSEKTLKNTDKQIGKIDFDDFKNFLEDLKELNKRLGFNLVTKDNEEDVILFFDSDGMDITLKDKNNKEYNYAQLNHMQYEATGKPGTFDTQGWDIDNKAAQKRAEKIVDYYKDDENFKEIYQLNLSINTFHKDIQESIKAEKEGNAELSQKKVFEYVDRQANMLFTFTPIIDKTKLSVRVSDPRDRNTTNDIKYYNIETQNLLNSLIIRKLGMMYIEDANGEKKQIKTMEEAQEKIKEWATKINKIYGVTPKGRMTQFYKNKDDVAHRVKKMKNLKKLLKEKGSLKDTKITGQIDINGKFYIFDDPVSCPTGLQFNYKNNDKRTRDLAFGLEKQYGLSEEFMKKNIKF